RLSGGKRRLCHGSGRDDRGFRGIRKNQRPFGKPEQEARNLEALICSCGGAAGPGTSWEPRRTHSWRLRRSPCGRRTQRPSRPPQSHPSKSNAKKRLPASNRRPCSAGRTTRGRSQRQSAYLDGNWNAKRSTGTIYCSLEPREKLVLFFENSVDPVSILAAGFNSGLDQASNRDPTFGQGGAGYARRFGADFASQTAARFFGDFLYPTVFSEDPRYYRMGQGSKRARLLHAVSHTIIAHRDNGTPAFNFTEWLGTASS